LYIIYTYNICIFAKDTIHAGHSVVVQISQFGALYDEIYNGRENVTHTVLLYGLDQGTMYRLKDSAPTKSSGRVQERVLGLTSEGPLTEHSPRGKYKVWLQT